MRTTLDIDDDVLAAAKHLASEQKTMAGKVISDLVRKALTEPSCKKVRYRNGFAVFPRRRGPRVTPELIDRLADEEA
jgi:hypothetical protein